jgi:hypothetical protein
VDIGDAHGCGAILQDDEIHRVGIGNRQRLRTRQRKDQRCDGKEQAPLEDERTRETEPLAKGYDSGLSETTDIMPALHKTQDPEKRQCARNG